MTPDQAAHYLAAMIDGEGWIGALTINPRTNAIHNRAIRIANTDPDLIAAMIECCDVLGIRYTVQNIKPRGAKWAAGHVLDITGYVSLKIVLDQVPIRAKRKRERLEAAVGSFKYTPLDPVELRRLYVDEGLTQRQVAAQLGVGYKRVLIAMRRHDIKRRTHAERMPSSWATRRERYGDLGLRSPHAGDEVEAVAQAPASVRTAEGEGVL